MKANLALLLATGALAISSAAEAATISGGYRVFASEDRDTILDDLEEIVGIDGDTTTTLTDEGGISGDVGIDLRVSAEASASYDITTGEIRALARANRGCGGPCELTHEPSALAGAGMTMAEDFVASADGTVTFYMEFDGNWSVRANFLGEPVSGTALGSLTAFTGFGSIIDQTFVQYRGGGPFDSSDPKRLIREMAPEGSPQDLLSLSFNVFEGQTYTIQQRIDLGLGNGFIDFTNTATLAFETTPGLSLLFSDSAFLSDMQPIIPGDGPVVPLPAAGWLMLAGFGGLVASKKKRSA